MHITVVITLMLALTATQLLAQRPSQTPWRRQMARAIDERDRAILHRNTRPEAMRRENDQGPLSDTFRLAHLQLLLKRSPEVEAALKQRIEQIHDEKSPHFRKWLSARELREDFGPAEADIEAAKSWLMSKGFSVNNIQPNGMVIDFSGTVGQVREAFKTRIHKLKVRGDVHIANTSDPSIPSGLAGVVSGVVSLHNFRPRAQSTPKPLYTKTSFGKTSYAMVPADLATIYNMKPLFENGISGQGQTIVVIGNSNVYDLNDWYTFREAFGLSSYNEGSLSQIHPAPVSGPNNCIDPGVGAPGYELEATLDTQWASAAAPSAHIVLASCKDVSTTFGGLIALQNIINSDNPPSIISISFGECETSNGMAGNAAYAAAYQQAAAMGTSVFVASGDSGGATCDFGQSAATRGITVNGLASTPYNVAVGGTDFADTFTNSSSTYWSPTNDPATFGSALSYVPEIPWNSTCASKLLSLHKGYASNHGSNSLCNSAFGQSLSLASGAGGGGPSGCATGTPDQGYIVSGTCQGYEKPSWQAVLNNPNDSVRDLPDVSLFAGNGAFSHYYVTCDSNPSINTTACTTAESTWTGAGGTSYGSPIWAGFQALINQYTGIRHGNPNPTYYALAAQQFGATGGGECDAIRGNTIGNSCVFYDVTVGDTIVPCTGSANCYVSSGSYGILSQNNTEQSPSFNATNGWDFATGLGTVNVTNLVEAFYAQNETPMITSSSSVRLVVGSPAKHEITTSGFPISSPVSLTYTGTLPAGVSFIDNLDGTASLVGAPTSNAGGNYSLQLTASNGISKAKQVFSITIEESPRFTSPANTYFTLGRGASFTISTIGTPSAVITLAGALPSGLSFTDNGNGTATISGVPTASVPSSYSLTLTATNGVSPSATQVLTLAIHQAPIITSSATLSTLVGQPVDFRIRTSGFPAPSLTIGPLPNGLALQDNGDGTATLSGTPAPSTTGTYSLQVVATNGISPNATQNFTLIVNQTPSFTNAASTTFLVGKQTTFFVTTSGHPKSSISLYSSLPSGLVFNDNGDGTARISGTPSANAGGAYTLVLVASNATSSSITQNFTLTVQQVPAFTSPSAASFVAGTSTAFTISTTGFPKAAISSASSLPNGLTLSNNGDGTATLSTTAASAAAGTHTITLIASNGVSPNASQNLTVTIAAGTNNQSGNSNTSPPPPTSGSTPSSGCDAVNGGKWHAGWLTYAILMLITIRLKRRFGRGS